MSRAVAIGATRLPADGRRSFRLALSKAPPILRRAATCLLLAAALLGAGIRGASAAEPSCPPAPDLSPAALAHEREHPRDRGFLWRLSRDGHDSYLFGTLHVGRPEWAVPGPRLQAALRASDVVALELDPLDALVAAAFERAVAKQSAPGVALSEDQRARLRRLARRACLGDAAPHEQHPMLQIMVITMLEARRERLDAGFAQEIVLSLAARALHRPVLSLETPELQAAALLPREPGLQGEEIERALAQLEDDASHGVLARLADAWERGDWDALQDYPRWCQCLVDDVDRASFARLNDGRNAALAERIAALHADGPRHVFAAVGALHMTGPQGLPLLLAQRHGFAVERVVLSR